MGSNEIGLWFFNNCLLPFLKSGTTSDFVFQVKPFLYSLKKSENQTRFVKKVQSFLNGFM